MASPDHATYFPEELHGLRGYVSSLEDGIGVRGVVQQPWIDGAYARIDLALKRHHALVAALAKAERERDAALDRESGTNDALDGLRWTRRRGG